MSATIAPTEPMTVALAQIDVEGNVRDALDAAHVNDLAASIGLRGLIVPLNVRPIADGRYRLVAGFHRYAACITAGLTEAPVTVRDREDASADTAAENILRKNLTPLEEARAVQAMFDEGYTVAGAAQILGWSKALVTARAKLLVLPEAAQQHIGTGEIPIGTVENLLRVNAIKPELVEAVAQSVTDGVFAGTQLTGNLGWCIGQAMQHGKVDGFAAYLNSVSTREIEQLKLGKRATAKLEEATKLHKQLHQYSYGGPDIRFDEELVDQARAAGVLIEVDEQRVPPIIVDRSLYRELCKQAIGRTVEQLEQQRQANAARQNSMRAEAAERPRTPRDDLDATHRASLREFARQAHGVNLDLGAALVDRLSTVDPADVNVAKFFAYGLLGPDVSHHMGGRDNVGRIIAANGIRLIFDTHRTETTKTLKSGARGKTKVAYNDVDEAQKALWTFVAGAKTAGEIYGRTLVVFAAQHYADQAVLPTAERRGSILPRSHQDKAAKAFEQLTKHILPGTHTALKRAIDREARSYRKQIEELDRAPKHPATDPAEQADDAAPGAGDQATQDVDHERAEAVTA